MQSHYSQSFFLKNRHKQIVHNYAMNNIIKKNTTQKVDPLNFVLLQKKKGCIALFRQMLQYVVGVKYIL